MAQPKKVTDFSELFGNKLLSDCRVKCGDQVWDLHKMVICTRSKFFEKALCGAFMEATTNSVTLHERDPKTVEWALECLYSGTLTHIEDEIRHIDTDMTAYRVLLQLYELGDFLDSDIICEAALRGMDVNNKAWAAKVSWHDKTIKCAKKSEAALRALFEFRHAFVDLAKQAYAYPKRKSSEKNTYILSHGSGVINLGPRDITTPFIHLMIFFKEHYDSSSASAGLIRKLQEVPELLGDMCSSHIREGLVASRPRLLRMTSSLCTHTMKTFCRGTSPTTNKPLGQ